MKLAWLQRESSQPATSTDSCSDLTGQLEKKSPPSCDSGPDERETGEGLRVIVGISVVEGYAETAVVVIAVVVVGVVVIGVVVVGLVVVRVVVVGVVAVAVVVVSLVVTAVVLAVAVVAVVVAAVVVESRLISVVVELKLKAVVIVVKDDVRSMSPFSAAAMSLIDV